MLWKCKIWVMYCVKLFKNLPPEFTFKVPQGSVLGQIYKIWSEKSMWMHWGCKDEQFNIANRKYDTNFESTAVKVKNITWNLIFVCFLGLIPVTAQMSLQSSSLSFILTDSIQQCKQWYCEPCKQSCFMFVAWSAAVSESSSDLCWETVCVQG